MKIWLMLSALSALLSAQEIYLFISPQGNDEWSGKSPEPVGKEGPFATLKRAQEEIRYLQKKGGLIAPVTVFLRGGFYSLKEPIVFLPEDSGSENAPITYCNYQNERVVLSGGRIITHFRPEGAYWTAEIPDVRNGSYRFQQLFVNGQRRFRARTPNKGWFRVRDPMESKNRPFHHYRYQFGYNPQDLDPRWRNLEDIEIVLLHFWSDAHCPIRAIDGEQAVVTLATPAWRPFTDDYSKRGARYFVDNVFEGLDEPGEWYLDRREGKLYYLPMPGEDIGTSMVVAPDLDQLIAFQGEPLFNRYVHHIRLKGLTFSHNDWFLPPGDPGDHFGADTVPGALKIVGGRDLCIEECRFEHLGTYAVEVRDGSQRITIRRNVIDDIGAGGFLITGGRAGTDSLLLTGRLQILDNSLFRLGRLYFAGIGILSMHASNNLIAHNEINDLYYTGISVGLEWGYKPSAAFGNVIECNLIANAGQGMLSDMGGIYTLGVSPGTVIRNNIVHDIETWGYGGWGIYTDEGSSGILIEKNIVYNTKSGGFHQHYGHDNVIRNNVFAFGRTAQLMRSRNETHRSFTFERNILYWKDSELLDKHWRGDTTQFLFRNNLYFRADGKPVRFAKLSAEKWQKRGQDRGSLFSDPKFVDPLKGDFNLQQDSPAFSIGFEPIDMTKVGPRRMPDVIKQVIYANDDGVAYRADFYGANSSGQRPLLVWLGGNDDQLYETAAAPFAKWSLLKDWVFLSPQLTAIRDLPESRQSAILLEAVAFALANAFVDTTRIYLFGYREGADPALKLFVKAPHYWAAVSVWNPTSGKGAEEGESELFELNRLWEPGHSSAAVDIVQHIYDAADSNALKTVFNLYEKKTGKGASAFPSENLLAGLRLEKNNMQIKDPFFAENCVLLRRQAAKVRLTIFSGKDDLLPNAALHWLEGQKKGH